METNTFTLSQLRQEELASLVEELRRSQEDLQARRFVETSLNRISVALRWRVEDTIELWVERILDELAQIVNALQSSLYLKIDHQDILRLTGTFAYNRNTLQEHVPFGDGLVGQVALTRNALQLSNANGNIQARNYSGTVTITPKSLIIQPLIYNEILEGVLEISSSEEFSPQETELIRLASENIAANLRTIRSQEELKRLYEEASANAKALKAQETERQQDLALLRKTNQELEAARNQMEQTRMQLEMQHHLLSNVINATDDLVFALDLNFKLTVGNSAFFEFCKHFGWHITTNADLKDFSFPQEIESDRKKWTSVFQGEVLRSERNFKINDSMTFWDTLYSPIRNENGVIIGGTAYWRNITDQVIAKRSQLEVAEMYLLQSRRLTAIINSTDDVIFTWNPSLELDFYNQRVEYFFRTHAGVQSGMPLRFLIRGDEFERLEPIFRKVLEGETLRVEFAYNREDFLETKYWDGHFVPVYDEEKNVVGGCAFMNDITARIIAQKELHQQDSKLMDLQLKLDTIMEAAQTSWLEINLKTEALTLSPQAAEVFGVSVTDSLHYNWLLVNMDEKDRQDFEKMLISAIDHHYNFQFDFKFRNQKGKELQCNSSVKLLKSDGKVNRLLMTLQAKETRKKTTPKEK